MEDLHLIMKLKSLYNTSNLPYVRLTDTKASGTAGTTYSAGSYQTITLNTENADTQSICTVSSNQFRLPEGIYAVSVQGPACAIDLSYALRIRNVSDSATLIKWPGRRSIVIAQAQATAASYNPTFYSHSLDHVSFDGRMVVSSTAANDNLELQIDVSASWAPAALSDGENEVYWALDIIKLD